MRLRVRPHACVHGLIYIRRLILTLEPQTKHHAAHAQGTDEGALDYALNRAIDAWYNDRQWFRGLQRRVMEQDWSWNRPALDYIELYMACFKG